MHAGHAVLLLLLTAGSDPLGPVPSSSGLPAEALQSGKAQGGAQPALDLEALKQQLKDTRAIGFFSKITLKNQVDDLLDDFSDYYEGDKKLTIERLRRSYDLLMMKVLSMLQDEDPKLASAIVSSREAIWDVLADPKKFAALKT